MKYGVYCNICLSVKIKNIYIYVSDYFRRLNVCNHQVSLLWCTGFQNNSRLRYVYKMETEEYDNPKEIRATLETYKKLADDFSNHDTILKVKHNIFFLSSSHKFNLIIYRYYYRIKRCCPT